MKIKKLSRGPKLNMNVLKKEADGVHPEYRELRERALEFMQDKDNLEKAREIVKNSQNEEDAARIISGLDSVIEKLEQQYLQEVVETERQLNEAYQEIIDDIGKEAEEFRKQGDDLRRIDLKQGKTDATVAAEEADAKKRELDNMHREEWERLRLQIEQQEQQRRYMQRRNISKR